MSGQHKTNMQRGHEWADEVIEQYESLGGAAPDSTKQAMDMLICALMAIHFDLQSIAVSVAEMSDR